MDDNQSITEVSDDTTIYRAPRFKHLSNLEKKIPYGLHEIDDNDIQAVVDLHGEATDIHHNNGFGIYARIFAYVKVQLPLQHNTSHDNGKEDREQHNVRWDHH